MTDRNRTLSFWKILLIAACVVAVFAIGLARPVANRYRLWRARQAIHHQEPQRALDWLELAAQSDDEQAEVYYLMARAQRHLEAYDKVDVYLQQAHRLGYPFDALEREKLMTMAESAQLAPDDPRLQNLLANPGNDTREIYEALVKGYYRLYEIGPAMLVLDTWEETYPKAPQPCLYRGLLREHDENWPEAEQWFRRALQLAPERRDLRLHLARTQRKQRRYREAESNYRIALDQHEDTESLVGLGQCLRGEGRLAEARDAFLKRLDHAPDDYDCLLALGELDVDAGRGAAALHWLELAAQQKPRGYDVRYALAKALLYAGKGELAKPHFRFVADARLALSRVKALRPYVANHPEDAELRYEIGIALLEYGEVSEALKWLHSVFKYEPNHRAAHAALAEYYAAQGNDEAAARHRNLAERPNSP